jgi:tagatose-1,6-bisphosphate aldolase non-catalytic subunit AgaZ/GatZ
MSTVTITTRALIDDAVAQRTTVLPFNVTTLEAALYPNLSSRSLPRPLIAQFMPDQYERVRAGKLEATPRTLVLDKVRDALRPYAAASLMNRRTNTTATNRGELLV